MNKTIAVASLLILISMTPMVFAQTNSTNSTSTNSTAPIIPISVEVEITDLPFLSITVEPIYVTNELVTLYGYGFSESTKVNIKITDTTGTVSDFSVFTTNDGDFSTSWATELANGTYNLEISEKAYHINSSIIYDGSIELGGIIFERITLPVIAVPSSTVTVPTTSSSSSSSSSSNTQISTIDTTLLQLIRAIIEANNAVLLEIERLLS